MSDQSAAILQLINAGVPAKDIALTLKVHRRTVYKVKQRAAETGSPQRRKRGPSQVPNSRKVVNASNIRRVKQKIERQPRRSMRKMASEMGFSEASARRIVKKLGMRSRAVQPQPLLTAQMRQNRLLRARKLLSNIKSANPKRIIIFSDEKIFRTDAKLNRRNDRYISQSPGDVDEGVKFSAKTKNPPGVMLFGVVASNGKKAPPVFFDEKVNSEVYVRALRDVLLPWVHREFPDGNVVFQQDSAPAHTARNTTEFLNSSNVEFWPRDMWPPNSPDANPLDYGIWAQIERRVNAKAHSSAQTLRATIRREWVHLDELFVRRTCRAFRSRLEAIVAADGGHFE